MTELVMVRAADDAALVAAARRIVGYLDRVPSASLTDVAYSCTFLEGPSVLAVVAESVADLRARLASAADRIATGSLRRIRDKSGTYWFREHLLGGERGKLAFVFPGVLSFYPDMLRDLAITYPECRSAFDELEEALVQEGSAFTPSNFIFPPAECYRRDADVFSSGAYAQALVSTYAACVALGRLMEGAGIRPEGVVGFAGGDLASMMGSGVAGAKPSRAERLGVIREIYRLVDKAVEHSGLPETAMVTLLLRHEGEADGVLAGLPEGAATLAIDFSPRQKTFAIAKDHEAMAMAAFAAAGIRAVRLALNRPFNTPACSSFVPAIRKFVNGWIREEPNCPAYSCALAAPVPRKVRKARAETSERWSRPVLFADTIRRMYADGYRVFLEVGPRGMMSTAVADTLKGEEHAAIALNSNHRRGILQLQHAVAQVAALGGGVDIYRDFMRRGARKLDFDVAFAVQTRRETELRLSRAFPQLTLLSDDAPFAHVSALAEPKGRGAKAAQRAAVQAAQARSLRQFASGASNPLVSDADVVALSPGVEIEIRKIFRISKYPFIGDFALGSSQLSYSDKGLRGLVLMSIPLAAEIMAEVASMLVPNGILVAVEGLSSRRHIAFEGDSLEVCVKAERIASGNPSHAAVQVQMRSTEPGATYTSPMMEATFVMAREPVPPRPVSVDPLGRPRSVHWEGRDIYPTRLCFGSRLRGISFADSWSESGVDYEVEVPRLAGCCEHAQFPLWVVNPLFLGIVVSGYSLWRSHERFSVWCGRERMDDAYSFPFRLRRLELHAPLPKEGTRVKCYLRLTGVTPKTLLCDIAVSDGNGNALMTVTGWEEAVEHVKSEYRSLIMQPATSFITRPIEDARLGEHPGIDTSSAFVTDIPYSVFERNEEVWLNTFSHVVLSGSERTVFKAMTGSVARRTEWLFGRIAAKEAVRRFMKDFHQARWSYADVIINSNDQGKPYAIGEWQDGLSSRLDIAIAHTAQFVVAIAAANARVGVDVESEARGLSEEFIVGVFAQEEQDIATAAPNSAQVLVRFWCAKEAVSKALGTGIRYSPREMVVSGYDVEHGSMTVRLKGAWADSFRSLAGRDLQVSVSIVQGHSLAFCFIPASVFDL